LVTEPLPTNNPFQKSYGCGACSGQSGFANSKIFCSFANDIEVRAELSKQGYIIPNETVFVAAHHDTCSDEVQFAGSHSLTKNQTESLAQLQIDFNLATGKNTAYRFKQFGIKNDTPIARALDWSQPRPEYGHSKVAMAVFGPRFLTSHFDLSRSFFFSFPMILQQI